jgi:hypothetical protein
MCPNCGQKLIPIHYGHVEHVDIERVILGLIYISDRYGLENFYCKNCQEKFTI